MFKQTIKLITQQIYTHTKGTVGNPHKTKLFANVTCQMILTLKLSSLESFNGLVIINRETNDQYSYLINMEIFSKFHI